MRYFPVAALFCDRRYRAGPIRGSIIGVIAHGGVHMRDARSSSSSPLLSSLIARPRAYLPRSRRLSSIDSGPPSYRNTDRFVDGRFHGALRKIGMAAGGEEEEEEETGFDLPCVMMTVIKMTKNHFERRFELQARSCPHERDRIPPVYAK